VPAYFFDSSALVKFYVNETGTVCVRSFTDSEDNLIHVASLVKKHGFRAYDAVQLKHLGATPTQ
jgi:predicted nucleic acid-binding protein